MKQLICLLALVFIISSCDKDDVTPNQGEINAKQIKQEVTKYSISGVYVYEPSNDDYGEWEMPTNQKLNFTIENNFLIVNDFAYYKVTYDLSKLLKYRVNYDSKTISLYFVN